jgi:hypothetical protein
MAATNGQSMQSSVKQSMNGFNCMKPKAGRFPDRHLFAKSKRLFDFIVEAEQHYRVHVSNIATLKKPTLKSLASGMRRLQERIEDMEDLIELREAIKRNAGRPGVPWEQVKKELDLD